MIDIIRSDARGGADHGWLKTRHTFSFAGYHNPDMMGFGKLRVVNEDRIEPGTGFGTHPHRDMEILTYVVDGAIAHKDSMGNEAVIRPGELQRMSAGTGVVHSEYNHSDENPAHFLQIWVLPEQNGLPPGYEQKFFGPEEKRNRWRLVASRDGSDGSLTIHQDVALYASLVDAGETVSHSFDGGRRGFLQVVNGSIEVDGESLLAGDAIALVDQPTLEVRAVENAELLLFDMA